MARISTHVLDTAKGRPAGGIAVELRRDGAVIASAVTNADGRTDSPLLSGDAIEIGFYEIVFDVAGYLDAPLFYDDITIRFQVTDAKGHCHVPLLLSPYGYSTYRGS